jgi:hypothetical protein
VATCHDVEGVAQLPNRQVSTVLAKMAVRLINRAADFDLLRY